MSSTLPKSKTISELPTTTVILGKKGPPAVQIPGTDAKVCAVLRGCWDSKETWKQESKLVIVSGWFGQCDQKGGAARGWEVAGAGGRHWGLCCRNHSATPVEWAGGASTRSCLSEIPE